MDLWENKKGFMQCDHYGMKGHVRDTCYRLKGYPEGFGSRNQRPRMMEPRGFTGPQKNYTATNLSQGEAVSEVSDTSNQQLRALMHTVETLHKEITKMKENRCSTNTELVNFAQCEEFAGLCVNEHDKKDGVSWIVDT
ncbi:hypothetical protein LIER_40847 [Lithospermum erythrorhizon]|uniref:Uncharacterized protein n=1 Tax=Lithospermum erythrorhizon TaxID=34254 RepID=A0AAV3R0T1_LITER